MLCVVCCVCGESKCVYVCALCVERESLCMCVLYVYECVLYVYEWVRVGVRMRVIYAPPQGELLRVVISLVVCASVTYVRCVIGLI